MMPKALSVIIVNYNGKKYLKDCLTALYDNLAGISFEIVMVDNASLDDSVVYVKANFPDVILVESQTNLGFGMANNVGVDRASGQKILLLNNDTILLDNLSPLLNILDHHPDFGVVTIKMRDAEKRYIPATGKFPTPFNLLKISSLTDKRAAFLSGKFDNTKLYPADWVTGAFMLMRKADFQQLGGFDTDYFMYVEDVDLCKRLVLTGKKCIFVPSLSYIHFVGFNNTRESQLIKGCEMYVSKHFSGLSRALAVSMLFINKSAKRILGKIK